MSKNYFSAYYIFNSLLILIYPILRNSGNKYMLKRKDNWGYQREDSIITILVSIILLRYIKYFSNWDKFICEIFFYSKFAICVLLALISRKIFFWYILACLLVWLLIKFPQYKGPSNIIEIANYQVFNELIISSQNKQKEKSNKKSHHNTTTKIEESYLFVIFYSNYSYDCLYTEELFANLSIKYYSNNLKFCRMNVDLNETFVEKLGIHLHHNVTLPYIIMFKNGKEEERLPGYDEKGKPKKMKYFREKDIVDIFRLKEIIKKEN